ncbi:MAG TPA: hypothetical protein ENI34_06650 [candidate division WOR-3 bacterium]|uniref:Glycosyl hydrolase family 13 catalytic domain-containing protein n=1 Tax=candidate division WOR-3 bacterium TaxID=2052148 RepID=A0A9C9K098_UNCW3|nr:hypothetical protein [candidate division WOR-3 bacterium]
MKYLVIIYILVFLPLISPAIQAGDVYHNYRSLFYVNPPASEIKLRTRKVGVREAYLIAGESRKRMKKVYSDKEFDYFVASSVPMDSGFSYYFLVLGTADTLRCPETGEFKPGVPHFTTPSWANGKIYYSIFPDGFYNGDPTNDPKKKLKWGERPKKWDPYGGDLKGITEKLSYIDSLGPDIILLQPIFSANSNHKLNPKDYATIDPHFGDTTDLKRLISEIHKRNKKIVLSVTFTHTGTDFPTFSDIMKNGKESKYINWYQIGSTPIKTSPPNYRCWRSDHRFPCLDLNNPQVKNYLIGYLEYWKHFGFDGFYIGEDTTITADFARTLRENLKRRYPDLLLLGSAPQLIGGNGFDGCYNSSITKLLRDYFINNTITTSDFNDRLQKWFFFSLPQVKGINLIKVSTYDQRIYKENFNKIKLLYVFLLTAIGSPVIMYGDEIGASGCEPLNPGSFNWNKNEQNTLLFEEVKRLIKIRKSTPQLQGDKFFTLYINDITKVYAYDRGGVIIVLNCGGRESFVELPAWDGVYLDLMSGEKVTAYSQRLRLSVDSGAYRILKREI